MFSVTLSMAGGLIAGKEGPFIHAGGIVGGGWAGMGSRYGPALAWQHKSSLWQLHAAIGFTFAQLTCYRLPLLCRAAMLQFSVPCMIIHSMQGSYVATQGVAHTCLLCVSEIFLRKSEDLVKQQLFGTECVGMTAICNEQEFSNCGVIPVCKSTVQDHH